MFSTFALFLGLFSPLTDVAQPGHWTISVSELTAQEPSPEQVQSTQPAVSPELVAAMTRYRDFVIKSERLMRLKHVAFTLHRVSFQKDEEGNPKEVTGDDLKIKIRLAPDYFDWTVRVESKSQGQDLVLVGTPGGEGFGLLGGVLQGHPIYARQARSNANLWAQFLLRWLNPDSKFLLNASYDGTRKLGADRRVDRILLKVLDPESGDTAAAWRLVVDAATGAPLQLESFDPETFELTNRVDYLTFHQVDGVRIPKRCEIIDGQGVKTGAMEFLEVHIDGDLADQLFEQPKN